MKQYYYQRKEVNYKMAQIDLTKYGITGTTEIVYNPSYEQLFEEETKPELEGYEKGRETELGAVNVMTGIYTGRSPKDKYIVVDENSKDTVWWTSDEYKNDNHPATQEAWAAVKEIAKKELSNKRLFVVDAFCGANKDTRMAIRFIVEVAWQAHFVTNMFIKPTAEELENFEPDFVVYNASKAKVENYKELGLNSETAVVFNITSREQVIINTWYGGEMKDILLSVTAMDKDGNIREYEPHEMGLGYRSSRFAKEGLIVLEAEIQLRKGNQGEIEASMKDLAARRRQKQPLEYPSAGSTFKRPEGYFAGKLIMDAGLRGFTVGGASVSEKHCGFVVNNGDATAADVCRLMHEVSDTVKAKFGVELEPEVKILGTDF
mgnify:CR=1 FL=1